MPLALGSLVGLWVTLPAIAVIVWRLLEEEKFLMRHLPGYEAYTQKTRYRLIPYFW
jgi:protein-S-isoprenylcysteine O-methyltransferase Ste14